MEILLAIVVASAVIFFGALISMANERQRKAIDGLREQVILWAIQDLKIKRKHLEHTTQIANPLDWLNKVSSNTCGHNLKLLSIESTEDPRIIKCCRGESDSYVVFTTLSPTEIQRIRKEKQNRLSNYTSFGSLISSIGKLQVLEISILNSDIYFDYEFELAWEKITGQKAENSDRFWMYL